MTEVTQSEYARHRGVTPAAVIKQVRSGKIPSRVNEEGRRLIDQEAADRALGANRVLVRATDKDPPLAVGLTKAKCDTEIYRGRLVKLEYEERVGRLLKREDVARSMERCAEAIVRDIDRLPTRAEDLAAAFTQGQLPGLRSALKAVARHIRSTLAFNMQLLGSDDVEIPVEDKV
jgi:hypothetical protein